MSCSSQMLWKRCGFTGLLLCAGCAMPLLGIVMGLEEAVVAGLSVNGPISGQATEIY